jgi:hypothetical protein
VSSSLQEQHVERILALELDCLTARKIWDVWLKGLMDGFTKAEKHARITTTLILL